MKTCEICLATHERMAYRTCGSESCLAEFDKRKKEALARAKRNLWRREREACLRDLGLTKVRGNLGGTYWE